MIDIVLRDDCGFRGFAVRRYKLLMWRNRRQRRRLRAGSKRRRACNKSKSEFQKVAAFHDIPPRQVVRDEESFAARR
jgi:hypothetical protein